MIPLSELMQAFQQLDLEVLLQPASSKAPEQLFVVFHPEGRDQPLYLQLLYLPGISDPHLLQYYVQLPVAFPDDTGTLGRFVLHLAPHLPVPGFEVNDAQQLLYYRHVRVCSAPEPKGIVETALVAIYVVNRFGLLVERAARGEAFDTLLRDLAEEVAEG